MILKYLDRRAWSLVVFCAFFITIQVFLDLQIPKYMDDITMSLQTGSSIEVIVDFGWRMVLCAVLSFLASMMTGYFAAKVAAILSRNLRLRLFDNVKTFTPQDMDRFSSASLITRSTNDIVQIQVFVAMALTTLVKAPIMACWALTRISGGSWEWTVATLIGMIVMVISIGYILWVTRPHYKAVPVLTDDINMHTTEQLSGLRSVRAYNAEKFQQEKFAETSEALKENDLFIWRRTSLLPPISMGVSDFLTLAIYWIGTLLIIDAYGVDMRQQLFSDMIVFSSYAIQVLMSFMMVTFLIQSSPRALVAITRVQEVIEYQAVIRDGDVDSSDDIKGEVEFRNVDFKYPDTDVTVLHDISFKVNRGETLAIIGSTGSGKTSLVNLIMRFYRPTSGQVLVDGVDVGDYSREKLNRKIGYVPQTNVTFSGTIGSNVAYGDMVDDIDADDIQRAIRIAQAAEFVDDFDDGPDHKVEQGGKNLSGGQKQRLSIARAICRNPEIFILDDSFSALDFKTDKILRHELRDSVKDSTFIIVAQRVGTIMDADQIIVLEEGHIVGQGKHDHLMETCDIYREIAISQMTEGTI